MITYAGRLLGILLLSGFKTKQNKKGPRGYPAGSVTEHAALDLGVMSPSCTLGVKFT